MDWARLGSLFLLELGFGLFAPLLLLRAAPLGPLFFRLLGGFAAAASVAGVALPAAAGGALPLVGGAGAALAALGFLAILRPARTSARTLALGAGTAGALLALVPATLGARAGLGAEAALVLVSSLGSGLVVGTIAVAMTLGHWYLVVPNLDVVHLRRANLASVGAMGTKLLASAALLAAFGGDLAGTALFRPMGLFHLGTRALVGLLVPIGFAGLVAGCLRNRNTRSATGILYASTVLVLIGEAVGLSLWGAYGIPL